MSTALRFVGAPLFFYLLILAGLFLLLVSATFFIVNHYRPAIFRDKSAIKIIIYHPIVYSIIGGVLLLLGVILLATTVPKILSFTGPVEEGIEISPASPVVIKFDRPINSNLIKKTVSPELPGKWIYSKNLFRSQYELRFIPDVSPLPDQRYTFEIDHIKNIAGIKQTKYLFSLPSLSVPKIESIDISDGEEGILPNKVINLKLKNYESKTVKINWTITPDIELTMEKDSDGFSLNPTTPFVKGARYNLVIDAVSLKFDYLKNEPVDEYLSTKLFEGSFKIIDAPGIKSYSPSGTGISAVSPVVIVFGQDMDHASVESAFSIKPSVQGTFSWSGDREVKFTSQNPFAKGTQYEVVMSKTAKVKSGESMEEDLRFSFTTIGVVDVSRFVPVNRSTNVALDAPISVTFNQEVDKNSAESKFTISPSLTGSFQWNGNTLMFNHSNMINSTVYTVSLAAGIKSINGLDSNKLISFSFTTKSQSVTLNIPSYKQSHMYSCMATAARDALAYRGISASENDVIARIGRDTTPWSGSWNEPGSTWGDPNVGIVGDVDGKADNIGWGYGAHWNPVAKAIRSYGKTAEVKSGWNASGIAQELSNGNPVIVWWVNGVWPAYEVRWNKDGQSIRGVNSMHVQVVKGFTGSVENPTSFIVNDSGYGYPSRTYDVSTFNSKWGWFGNTAIVVY